MISDKEVRVIQLHVNYLNISELRGSYLSYSILKVQRNEYITFMLIYVSLALNVYIQILDYMYLKR
jgi:hypothetical protein